MIRSTERTRTANSHVDHIGKHHHHGKSRERDHNQGSVSDLLLELKDGNSEAERELWRRYFPSLCSVARAKFGAHSCRIANEEDIAISVFDLLYRGAREDRFNKLDSRTDLWRLLVLIASNKVTDQIRRDLAKKRGGGNTMSLLEGVITEIPTDDDLLVLQETFELLFEKLDDDILREVARLRLEGHSKSEVAELIKVSTRTIERKLNLIYAIWVTVRSE